MNVLALTMRQRERERERETWFDHMIVQETCPTYADSTWRFLEEDIVNLPENGPAFKTSFVPVAWTLLRADVCGSAVS